MAHRDIILSELNFVGFENGRLDFWLQVPCRDWLACCELGRYRAEQAIQFMKRHGDPSLLGRIAAARSEKRVVDAVQVGYAARIAEFILTGR